MPPEKRTLTVISKELVDNPILPLLFFQEGVKNAVAKEELLTQDILVWFGMFLLFTMIWVLSDSLEELAEFTKKNIIGGEE